MLLEYCQGKAREYFRRRDDNYLDRDETARYFHTWDDLPDHQRCLLQHACGRVLDIGAGAGQHTLALQQRGLQVLAIDVSPLAVEVCRRRGVRNAEVMDARALTCEPASFDTALLLGNNLGIAGTPEGLRAMLLRLHEIIRPGGQILADIPDYTATVNAAHLRYQRLNHARGRYPGSIGQRIEYDGCCGPHFDWLLTTFRDLRDIIADTGWKIKRCVQVNEGLYSVVMERCVPVA